MKRLTLLAIAVGCCVAPALTPADTADDVAAKLLESLFGDEMRKVRASRGFEDDIALARQLIALARRDDQSPALAGVLARAAHDLTATTKAGFPTAIEAMETLKTRMPSETTAADAAILDLRRRAYASALGSARRPAGVALIGALDRSATAAAEADDYVQAGRLIRQGAAMAAAFRDPRAKALQDKAKRWSALTITAQKARQLQAKLKADPSDVLARTHLAKLYLVELDRPDKAAEYLTADCDEILRTYVPLAGKKIDDLAEGACMELGTWYHGLAGKAVSTAKPAMLQRSLAYFQAYLARHEAEDVSRAKAKLMTQQIQAELKKLGVTVEPEWIDLLAMIDPAKHTVHGQWHKDGARLGATATSYFRVGAPLAPKGDYEFQARFVRKAGDNDVNFILPVGSTSVIIMLSGQNGQASGLSTIDGQYCHVKSNPTRAPGTLTNGQSYTLHAIVRTKADQAQITATLNGKKLLAWSGRAARLSAGKYWSLPNPATIGLGLDRNSTGVFYSARLRMLSGKAEPADPHKRPVVSEAERDRRRREALRAEEEARRRRKEAMRKEYERRKPHRRDHR